MSKMPPPAGYDDNPEWTEEDFARARPASEVLSPELLGVLLRSRGAQQAEIKQQVTLRLDRDVVAKFRATGRGWQTRMNAALREAKV